MALSPENPWRCLSIQKVFENPWIRLETHDVINPAGNPNVYGKICFKNQSVGIIPIDDEGYTWLVGQHRYTLESYSWEIPEGGSPEGEEPIETAKRELEEETGLIADKLNLFLHLHTSNSVTDEEGFVFIARQLSKGKSCLEDTENITCKRVKLDKAIEMAMDGEITDVMSLAALFKLSIIYSSGNFLDNALEEPVNNSV